MKFEYSMYELFPKGSLKSETIVEPRRGALLKVEWNSEKIGYADLHPWPEFGDPELEEHLSELRNRKLTNLVEQAIWLASLDAKCRLEKVNIYDQQKILRNNGILTAASETSVERLDPFVVEGFQKVKIKVGYDLQSEVEMLNRAALTHSQLKFRLDFNSRLTGPSFEKFVKRLTPPAQRMVEYVEDPFPYHPELWKEARSLLPLAIDWELRHIPVDQERPVEADVLVVKPTHQDVNARLEQCQRWGRQMVITSHMGHPLGVMQCQAIAQDFAKRFPEIMLDPGCLTFDLYEPTVFNKELNVQGPFVRRVAGWGIGFDLLLKGQQWNRLKTQV